MIIYPAIDLFDGKVVRLRKGNFDEVTVYSEDPLSIAEKMIEEGASWLHVVDLDGAREGAPKNLKTIYRMHNELNPRIQYGGGLRSILHIEDSFEAGISRAILSTRVLTDPDFLHLVCSTYPEVIAISIDVAGETVRISGWEDESSMSVSEAITTVEEAGASRVIYTDIERDGMNIGPNLESLKKVLELTSLPVIYAGGVSSINDLEEMNKLKRDGLDGVIIGKAYYDGLIDLTEAIKKYEYQVEDDNYVG